MSGWTDTQERAAAAWLQQQTAIASFELCVTFVRGMVRAAVIASGSGERLKP